MTDSNTGVDKVLLNNSDTFRRDKYLAPHNIHELMRIDKIIRELPLSDPIKAQVEEP